MEVAVHQEAFSCGLPALRNLFLACQCEVELPAVLGMTGIMGSMWEPVSQGQPRAELLLFLPECFAAPAALLLMH